MNYRAIAVVLVLIAGVLLGCRSINTPSGQSVMDQNTLLNALNDRLTEATIAGTLSPPAAARCFAYANIGAYEAVSLGSIKTQSLSGRIEGLVLASREIDTTRYIKELALVKAFSALAREGVYHPQVIDELESTLIDSLSKRVGSEKAKYTLDVSETLVSELRDWMRTDGFTEMRVNPRYQLLDEPWSWEPTPPKYSEALDPWWHSVRTFVLDSASLFRSQLKVPFSTEKGSKFYQYAEEVRTSVEQLNTEQRSIADFWDCNPYLTKREGHSIRAVRQLSPGAHWIGLVRDACTRNGLELEESLFTTVVTAIALHDGFISVWDTKYHYHLIRPETYINRHIDPKWRPMLESPHFPEYTSGHSVISAAASTVLSDFFGSNYAFTDSLELPFGKHPRAFNSFKEASDEAAMSRLYGGIHYRFSNNDGVAQGKKVGQLVLKRLVSEK